jgi:type VI secretion system secreted protein VgrG
VYQYPGGYPDAPKQGEPLATARVERYRIEAMYGVGAGTVRVLSAGSVFSLEHKEADHEGEYVVTALFASGEQQGVVALPSGDQSKPWEARFELARRGSGANVEESRFRPAVQTPKPRVRGAQTAVVTADPGASGAEVNVGGPDGLSIGCVRVRFRWDTEEARLAKEPSSTWLRVSQVFAGAGEGAVWHPRVGDEVLVDHEEGDPDRPIVVGRVYNGANLPARKSPSESSLKSLSTPGGGTYNEIMFEDSGGGELLHYFAGKDQTTDVANFRRESVVTNATMIVGANNDETIGANRTETVGANDTLTVGANQTITIGANSTTLIGGNLTHKVGANEVNIVGGSQGIFIGGNITETVGAVVLESYGASRKTTVGGAVSENFGAAMTVNVGGNVDEKCATHSVTVSAARLMAISGNYKTNVSGSNTTNVGAVVIEASGGSQDNKVAGTITRTGPFHFTLSGFEDDIRAFHADAQGSSESTTAVSIAVTGHSRTAYGIKISKKSTSHSVTGLEDKLCGAEIKLWGIGMMASGVNNQAGGPQGEGP